METKKYSRRIWVMAAEKVLRRAGIPTWAIHLSRIQVLLLLYIACYQLYIIKRYNINKYTPRIVYLNLKVLLDSYIRGHKANPSLVFSRWARGQCEGWREREEGRGRKIRCPLCGVGDYETTVDADVDEMLRQQILQQIHDDEAKSSQCDSRGDGEAGARGSGADGVVCRSGSAPSAEK